MSDDDFDYRFVAKHSDEQMDALRAENERLRAALETIVADAPVDEPPVGYVQSLSLVLLGERRGRWQAAQIAREALGLNQVEGRR